MCITVDGPTIATKISEAIFGEVTSLPEFDLTLAVMVHEEAEQLDSRRGERLRELVRIEEKLDRTIENIVGSLREAGSSPALVAELRRLEEQKSQLAVDREEVERLPRHAIEIPSVETVRELARESMNGLARNSPEYGRLMRRLIPKITVHPYQLIDSKRIVLRARFTLNLASLVPSADQFACLRPSLSRSMQVDLFGPPQRERFREQVVALRQQGCTEREAARRLGITQPAVQRAMALDRMMRARGLTDPYILVLQPSVEPGKLLARDIARHLARDDCLMDDHR